MALVALALALASTTMTPPDAWGLDPRAGVRRRVGPGLTPLIDVVFLLLIFFMLASVFARPQSLVLSPAPGPYDTLPASADVIEVRVGADGMLVNGEAIAVEFLRPHLAALLAALPGAPVTVLVAEGATVQDLAWALDAARAAGAGNVRTVRLSPEALGAGP